MTVRILLIGSRGQIGWELRRALLPIGELLTPERSALDLSDKTRTRSIIREIQPDLIVNAAAYTAVDGAEREPQLAMAINGVAPRVLAEEADRLGSALIHYSTDYVFDGKKGKPYTEKDPPNPLNVYGESKLAGEAAIQEVGGAFLIIRTSWVYGHRRQNFLLSMAKLARERRTIRIVDDQVGCPTWSKVVAEATCEILGWMGSRGPSLRDSIENEKGIYHYAAAGETSWYGFAEAVLQSDPNRGEHIVEELIPVSSLEYGAEATRPANSVLATERTRNLIGIRPQHWRIQLRSCWDANQENDELHEDIISA